jgi:hypothetical protein
VEGLNPSLIRLKLETYDMAPVKSRKPKAAAKAGAPAKAKAGPHPAEALK